VQRGSCPEVTEPCAEGTIQNIDFTSTTACACEALHAYEGELIDLSVDTRFDFAMDKHFKFTLREWAMTTGEYEWTLPSETEIAALPCLTMIGEAFDDGRYRQVSFEATTPDCRG